MTNRHLVRASLICVIGSLGAGTALAQGILEEVVVTATKRAQSIQDVPVSVSTISSEQLDIQGISNMEDLSLHVPNFEINSASILPNLYMRGLGPGATHSIEQSVGPLRRRRLHQPRGHQPAWGSWTWRTWSSCAVRKAPCSGRTPWPGALIINTADPTASF